MVINQLIKDHHINFECSCGEKQGTALYHNILLTSLDKKEDKLVSITQQIPIEVALKFNSALHQGEKWAITITKLAITIPTSAISLFCYCRIQSFDNVFSTFLSYTLKYSKQLEHRWRSQKQDKQVEVLVNALSNAFNYANHVNPQDRPLEGELITSSTFLRKIDQSFPYQIENDFNLLKDRIKYLFIELPSNENFATEKIKDNIKKGKEQLDQKLIKEFGCTFEVYCNIYTALIENIINYPLQND